MNQINKYPKFRLPSISSFIFIDVLTGIVIGVIALFAGIIVYGNLNHVTNMNILGESNSVFIASAQPNKNYDNVYNPENISIVGSRKWFLITEMIDSIEKTLGLTISLTPDQLKPLNSIDNYSIKWKIVESGETGFFVHDTNNNALYLAQVDTSRMKPNTYHVVAVVTINNRDYLSSSYEFVVSEPVYVTWTIDWEGYDVKQAYLDSMAEISTNHAVPMTHFFNPRLYTSGVITDDRREYLTKWVIDRRDNHNESIGLHLHMFPDMVEAAGVKPVRNPIQWGSDLKDGYDIVTTQYSYTDMVKMLNWSKEIFISNRLGTPTMYRAGGWFANEDTLKAVQDTGFTIDSSGREFYSFGKNDLTGPWNLSSTTQPYRPSIEDQNISDGETLSIWEFPNNGGDSWTYLAEQMIERFSDNYSGGVNTSTRIVTYLSHPEWFHIDKSKIEKVFDHVDQFLYTKDLGPVIYTTIDKIPVPTNQ